MHTRERILQEALSLFSEKGYEAVSVRDIARAVGIKESSLYNHFQNKQDIYDSILSAYPKRGTELFSQYDIADQQGYFAADGRTVDVYQKMNREQFIAMTSLVFSFYFTDEINVKLRKMLTIEQFRNPEAARLYRELSFENSITYQTELFAAFMKAGSFVQVDPYILAVEFFAPVFLIFCKFDNNEESLRDAKELFERHIRHFCDMYAIS